MITSIIPTILLNVFLALPPMGKSHFEDNKKQHFAAYANQLKTDPDPTIRATYLYVLKTDRKMLKGGAGGDVFWNPEGTLLPTTDGYLKNAVTDLGHELFHGLDANRGKLDCRIHLGISRTEWQASYRENVLREQLGVPLRTRYNNIFIVINNYKIFPPGWLHIK